MNTRLSLLLAPLLAAPAAYAHHSFAPHFDVDKPVDISGTVTEYEARNPHSYLHIAAVDENGKTQEYVCESHGVTQLTRNGITPEMLKPGTEFASTARCRGTARTCASSTTSTSPTAARSTSTDRAARSARAGSARCRRARTSSAPGCSRRCAGPAPHGTSRPQPMMNSLTPAGEAAVAAYDPFKDDPTFRCDPVAIRRVWGAPGTPLEIVRERRRVVLRHEWMDVVRTCIHLNTREHPANGPRTSLGHSIGHFDGDTLVIETANYSAGVLNQYVEEPGKPTRGLLHSAALTSVERLSFDAERQRLVVEVALKDPEFFTRDFDVSRSEYAPSDLTIEPFNCSPEGVTGTIEQ